MNPGGVVVKAGRGKGHWRTFGVPEGLPSPIVWAVLQDRAGDLWFGTMEGGVSRYDPSAGSGQAGERFTTFTTKDGLADNGVNAILEDRAGQLWFGTGGGVSRYDGGGSHHLAA